METYFLKLAFLLCAAFLMCNGDGLSHTDSRSIYAHYGNSGCMTLQGFSKIFLDFDTFPEDQQISIREFTAGWKMDHLHDTQEVPFFFELVDHSPRDNEITMHEITALYNNVFDDHPVSRGNGLPHTDSRKLYTQYNTNSDSCLSQQEFANIFLDFDTWPKDQQISQAEFSAGWKMDHLYDTQDVPFFFELVDHSPRDNEITMYEITALYKNVFDDHHHNCVSSYRFDYVWSSMFVTV